MSSPIEIVSLGRFAHAALHSREARVIAVFERSCYVETTGGLACIGMVGNGPLNARCVNSMEGVAVGDAVRVVMERATIWRPRPAPAWNAAAVRESLARLTVAARDRLPGEGFGYLLEPAREQPATVRALACWLASPTGVPGGAAGLVGLGPGLTPSGDDLIGGALCALHATGRTQSAERLAAWVLPLAATGTSRISRAHLACAVEGECGETVNDAIVALLSGESPDLARIHAIGHTSGWDALAGVTLALRAIAEERS